MLCSEVLVGRAECAGYHSVTEIIHLSCSKYCLVYIYRPFQNSLSFKQPQLVKYSQYDAYMPGSHKMLYAQILLFHLAVSEACKIKSIIKYYSWVSKGYAPSWAIFHIVRVKKRANHPIHSLWTNK